MKEKMGKRWYYAAVGLAAGLLNGLFGTGGGTVVVPLLERGGIPAQKAHATSIAVILPLSICSALVYLRGMEPQWMELVRFLPLGFVGALAGARLLRRVNDKVLRRIFGLLILAAAVRLWMR